MKMMILVTTMQLGRHSALLLPVPHLLTALLRRMRWQRSRATMSQLQCNVPSGLGIWMAILMTRRLRAGRFFSWFFLILDLSFRYHSCLAAGLLMGNNHIRVRSHGTRKGAWFPPLLVCEFERGAKS